MKYNLFLSCKTNAEFFKSCNFILQTLISFFGWLTKEPSFFHDLSITANVSIDEGKAWKFERNQYSKVEWSSDSNNKGDDTSIFANIFVKTSGSFHFYIKNTR